MDKRAHINFLEEESEDEEFISNLEEGLPLQELLFKLKEHCRNNGSQIIDNLTLDKFETYVYSKLD